MTKLSSNISQAGILTLTLLLLLSSTLLIMMLFNDDLLRLYTNMLMQRKTYVQTSLQLQQQSAVEKQKICQTLPLDFSGNRYLAEFKGKNQANGIAQYVWCERKSLIKQAPRKAVTEGEFNNFVNDELFATFQKQYHSPLHTEKSTDFRVYWLNGEHLIWQLSGNISALVIADGNLTIQGKGKISGAVIVKGKLTKADTVQISYKKQVVTTLVQALSYWHLKEKSWRDFNEL